MSAVNKKEAEQIMNEENALEDELELDLDDVPAHIRDARLLELKAQADRLRAIAEGDHVRYIELVEEKDFLDLTTQTEKCVVHFFHADFRRCAIMDKHLKIISGKFFETKFAKINVDKSKFFVEKLKIRVLPAVLCFKDGIVCDRIIGFEDFGNSDDFPTRKLEKRLGKAGMIEVSLESDEEEEEEQKPGRQKKSIFGAERNDSSDDNDW